MDLGIMKNFVPKGMIKKVALGLTEAIDGMQNNDLEAKGNPVRIVAFKKRVVKEGKVTGYEPEVRFCYFDSEQNKLITYKSFNKDFIEKSADFKTKMLVKQLVPMIMKLIDKYEKENNGQMIVFQLFNEFDENMKRKTLITMTAGKKEITKIDFLEVLDMI
jgi:hypothetical protein